MIPPSAKREQRFSAEGGREPKVVRGERSQGRSVRRGTRSAQVRLCERGRSGRGPRRTPEGILDAAGDSPPARKARAGFTRSFAVLDVDPIGMLRVLRISDCSGSGRLPFVIGQIAAVCFPGEVAGIDDDYACISGAVVYHSLFVANVSQTEAIR